MTGERTATPTFVLGRVDGSTLVRPSLEVLLTESPARLRKSVDPKPGLAVSELD